MEGRSLRACRVVGKWRSSGGGGVPLFLPFLYHSPLLSLKHAPMLSTHGSNVQPHDKAARRGRTSWAHKKQTCRHSLMDICLSLHAVSILQGTALSLSPTLSTSICSDGGVCPPAEETAPSSLPSIFGVLFEPSACQAARDIIAGLDCRSRPLAHVITSLARPSFFFFPQFVMTSGFFNLQFEQKQCA